MPSDATPPTRVVLVDDNELTLNGYSHVLQDRPDIQLLAAVGHGEALRRSCLWSQADVVLLDAADETQLGDHFPGVRVVHAIRKHQGTNRPVVVTVTAHFFNDGLRHRMADAGADFFFLRSDLRHPQTLVDLVTCPERYRRGVPELETPATPTTLGIGRRSDVQGLVSYIDDNELHHALDGDRVDPRSRRWLRHRKALGDQAQIHAVNLTTGDPPTRNQRHPSLRQLAVVYRWLARITPPHRNELE